MSKVKNIANNETLRNGAFFTAFSFINRGINFILLIVLAKYITPAEYGYWSLFGIIIMFLGYFIAMTTQGYLSVSFFQEGLVGVKKTFSCVFLTSVIVAISMSVFVWFFQPFFNTYLDFPWQYLYLAITISFFTVYSNMCLDFFRIRKNIKIYGLFSCCCAALVLILSFFFVRNLTTGWIGCILAQLICVCLFGGISIVYFIRMGCLSIPNIRHWKIMLMWGIPLIPHIATNFIQQGCDRYIINHFYNVEQVGLFSFAYSLSAAIIMIGYGFNDANSVNIFEVLGKKDLSANQKVILLRKQKKKVFFVYLISTIAITSLCCIFVPFCFSQYVSSVKYFILLAIYAFGECLYFLYGNFLFFFNQTKKIMTITFSFAMLHFFFSLLLTQYSIYYTCLTYCATQLGIVLFVRKSAIKTLESNLNYKIRNF